MADCLMKNLRKKTGRAKETLLESLGKADRTTDLRFEELHADFAKQNKAADNLQSHLKTYVMSMRVANQALRGYHDAIRDIYEPEWGSGEHIRTLTHQNELIWDDFVEKLYEETLVPVNVYGQRFVDLKGKIAKRGRKLVDYDGARHTLTTVQNSPKRSDEKVQKAHEEMSNTKNVYESLNNELLTELPELYESRTPFIINNLHSFYNLHTSFFTDTVQVFQDIRDQIKYDSLNVSVAAPVVRETNGPVYTNGVASEPRDLVGQPVEQRGDVTPVKLPSVEKIVIKPLVYTPSPTLVDSRDQTMFAPQHNESVPSLTTYSPALEVPTAVNLTKHEEPLAAASNCSLAATIDSVAKAPDLIYKEVSLVEEAASDKLTQVDGVAKVPEKLYKEESGFVTNGSAIRENIKSNADAADISRLSLYFDANDNLKELTPPTTNTKPVVQELTAVSYTVLYRVRATHMYKAEDTDELSFEVGDIIAVVPFTEEDEVDDGWAMGMKEDTGEKGVFPMNFTKNA